MKTGLPQGTRADSRVMFALALGSWVFVGLLSIPLFCTSAAPFVFQPHVSAIALVLLLLSLPAMDEAVFGTGKAPAAAGLPFGLALGFFVHQAWIGTETSNEFIASGAERILGFAFLVAIAIRFLRVRRRRQRD